MTGYDGDREEIEDKMRRNYDFFFKNFVIICWILYWFLKIF